MNEEFKILKVIGTTQLVLSGGSDDGITIRSRFLIYALGEVITDEETGAAYEALEITKGHARVKHLQKKITTIISEDFMSKRVQAPGLLALQGTSETIQVIQPFDDARVGDRARLIG